MLGVTLDMEQYLARLQAEVARLDRSGAERLSCLLYQAWEGGKFVFVFGNGGSATTASHLAEDLGKNTFPQHEGEDARRLKIISLTDNTGWITALGNDCGYDRIFVEQLAHYATPGDLAIAISGSGNSPNVLAAVDWANRHGLVTFGLTGFDGGKLKPMVEHGAHVALDDMAMVESLHVCLCHWVVDDLYARINKVGRYAV